MATPEANDDFADRMLSSSALPMFILGTIGALVGIVGGAVQGFSMGGVGGAVLGAALGATALGLVGIVAGLLVGAAVAWTVGVLVNWGCLIVFVLATIAFISFAWLFWGVGKP